MNAGPTHRARFGKTTKAPGDVFGSWTLLRMTEDGKTVFERKWLIECDCGYQAFRWESDLKPSRMIKCGACMAGERTGSGR